MDVCVHTCAIHVHFHTCIHIYMKELEVNRVERVSLLSKQLDDLMLGHITTRQIKVPRPDTCDKCHTYCLFSSFFVLVLM